MKKLAQEIVYYKLVNYFIAMVVFFLLFIGLYLGLYAKIQTKAQTSHGLDLFFFWGLLLLSFWVVHKSKLTSPPRQARHLIDSIFGEETDVWIEGTTRYGFYLFYFDKRSQTISIEKDDIIVTINCTDIVGKLLDIKTSGTWVAGKSEDQRAAFKSLEDNEEENEILIRNVLERATNRLIDSKEYWAGMKGKHDNLISELKNDPIFKSDCESYGITFPSLAIIVKSGDQATDNFNAQYDRELAKLQSKYPTNHKFTHDQLKDMSDLIFIKLGRAKQLVVRGGAIVRADASVN